MLTQPSTQPSYPPQPLNFPLPPDRMYIDGALQKMNLRVIVIFILIFMKWKWTLMEFSAFTDKIGHKKTFLFSNISDWEWSHPWVKPISKNQFAGHNGFKTSLCLSPVKSGVEWKDVAEVCWAHRGSVAARQAENEWPVEENPPNDARVPLLSHSLHLYLSQSLSSTVTSSFVPHFLSTSLLVSLFSLSFSFVTALSFCVLYNPGAGSWGRKSITCIVQGRKRTSPIV